MYACGLRISETVELPVSAADSKHVGRLSQDHTDRRNPTVFDRLLATGHHAVQQLGCFTTDAFRIRVDAGQWRVAQIEKCLLVVDTEHRHLLRNRHFRASTGLEHVLTALVV